MPKSEVDVVIRCEKVIEFPILAEKLDSISVKTFFFFGDHPVFERKKRLNFRAFREIPSQFSDKPCETDSRIMKIRVKVVCTFLTLSKKPPLFQILATRLLATISNYQLWYADGFTHFVEYLFALFRRTVGDCVLVSSFHFSNLMDILWLVIVLLWSFCTGSAANYYYYIYHTRWRLYVTTFFIECLAGKL